MKLTTINEDSTDLLQKFVDLNLTDSPTFEVARNIQANDMDEIDGEMVTIPISVVSYDTMQKYIVPRKNNFLVPVPKGDNWAIYYISSQILQQIISILSDAPGSLDDFYDMIDASGTLYRMYY